jgi:hypothetical protein
MKKLVITILLCLLPVVARAQNVQGNQHTPAGSLEGSHQFTGNKCTATSVTWHTIAPRWLMIFDTQTMPPSGQLTPNMPLIVCQFIQGAGNQQDGTQNFDWNTHPIIVTSGLLVVVSVNPQGCTAMTPDGNNNWIAGQMQ